MWKKNWGYKEGFAVNLGLVLVGLLLQITAGRVNLDFLRFPVNIIIAWVYPGIMIAIYIVWGKKMLVRWMSSLSAAISSIVFMIGIIILMGLIRQLPDNQIAYGISRITGFSQMLSSWVFCLLFFWFITLLGFVIIRKIHYFKLRDIPFILNHAGLFIALSGSVLGSTEMQRLEMTTMIGKPEWRAVNDQKKIKELPLTIELKQFSIEEYPPKLMLLDNTTGKVLPEDKPVSVVLEDNFQKDCLLDWEIELKERYSMAARVTSGDTVKYVEYLSTGAAYAVYVHVKNNRTGEVKEGWISCGSFMFPYKALYLNQDYSIIMPEPEPKKFTSDVHIYTQSGLSEDAIIEVNKPYKLEGWKIYQLNYDTKKGRWSDISIFELVYDPWLPIVYIGIWMMIAGAVCLFLFPKRKKKEVKS